MGKEVTITNIRNPISYFHRITRYGITTSKAHNAINASSNVDVSEIKKLISNTTKIEYLTLQDYDKSQTCKVEPKVLPFFQCEIYYVGSHKTK